MTPQILDLLEEVSMRTQLTFRHAPQLGAAALLLILSAPQSAFSQDWDNDNANQDWDDPVNWAGDAFPAGNAVVNNVTPVGVDHPIVSATPSFTPVDIFVGTGAGNEGRLDQTSGTLSTGAGNWMFVGHEGGVGTYNLNGDGSLNAAAMNIGAWGGNGATGEVNVNTTGVVELNGGGGRPFGFGDASLLVGENNGTGTLNLDAGTINSLFTSRFGHGNSIGNLNITGGALNTAGELMLASTGDGIANVAQSGGTNTSTGFFVVGRNGAGVYNMSGGAVNAATDFGFAVLGSFGGASGELNLSGGDFNTGDADTNAALLVGEGGIGTVNHSGGSMNVTENLLVGVLDSGVGAYNLIGSGAVTSVAGDLLVGLDGAGVDTLALGTLGFTADATGVSVLNIGGDVNLSSPDGDFLTVDLSAYVGPPQDLLLIDGLTSQGEFTGLSQGTVVPTGGGGFYAIDYSVAGDVWLRLVPEPASLLMAVLASCAFCIQRRKQH